MVLQELRGNKMIIRKPREKDDYRSDGLMTNLVNVGRQICGLRSAVISGYDN